MADTSVTRMWQSVLLHLNRLQAFADSNPPDLLFAHPSEKALLQLTDALSALPARLGHTTLVGLVNYQQVGVFTAS